MKAFGMLLLYFFTWRSVIIGSVFAGFALVALALNLMLLAPYSAFSAALLAFGMLLVVPYVSAPKALRVIISNRRLAIVPGLPLMTGLAMLLLTLLTAAFLPLSGWLLDRPDITVWFGLKIFIIASLYTLMMQILLTSPHMLVGLSWAPIVIMLLVAVFREQLLLLSASNPAVTLVALLTLAVWLYALMVLARQRNFKPQHAVDQSAFHGGDFTAVATWFGHKSDLPLSPAGSLLFGYPANLLSRVMNIAMYLVVAPLVQVVLLEVFRGIVAKDMPLDNTDLFLGMSLFSGCVNCMVYGETGARARLLWLRLPGARAQVWEKLERELWTNFLVQLALTILIAGVIALYGRGSVFLVHYVLIIFSCSLYDSYLNLCARLNGWSSLVQAVVMIASLAALAFTIVYSLRTASLNVVLILELCLLLLSVLFRALAKYGFARVDWLVLRHTVAGRTVEKS